MKSSRDPQYLESQLRSRINLAFLDWKKLYPGKPQPFITDIYRDEIDQEKAFKSKNSNAHFGESLHNYIPSYAVDIAFKTAAGKPEWSKPLYRKFAPLARSYGLIWGADWDNDGKFEEPGETDMPHFQLPMTWQDAKAGRVPKLSAQEAEKFTPSELGKLAKSSSENGKITRDEAISFIKTLIKIIK